MELGSFVPWQIRIVLRERSDGIETEMKLPQIDKVVQADEIDVAILCHKSSVMAGLGQRQYSNL